MPGVRDDGCRPLPSRAVTKYRATPRHTVGTIAALAALAVAAATLAPVAAASDATVQTDSGAFTDDDGSVHEAGLDAMAFRGLSGRHRMRGRADLPITAAEALGDGSVARSGSQLRRTRTHHRVPIRGCRRRRMVGAPCGALRRDGRDRRLQAGAPALLPRPARQPSPDGHFLRARLQVARRAVGRIRRHCRQHPRVEHRRARGGGGSLSAAGPNPCCTAPARPSTGPRWPPCWPEPSGSSSRLRPRL